MEPGALRRRLDDIYLHRRERGSILSAVHEHVSPNLAETQPMSVEICFRLNIWPLQQLSALPEFHFLFNMDPRDASVDLLYQEHLLQWMTVGDLLGDLVGRMETHHGGRCGKRSICIAAEGHRLQYVLARLDLHRFQVILAWVSLCAWYKLCRVNRQWSRWLRASPTFQSVASDARSSKDPELLSIQREVRANEE